MPKLRSYIEAASQEQPHSGHLKQQRAATEKAYLDLLTTLSQLPSADNVVLLVVAFFDAPFEVVLRHEPEKTMREALEKL